MPAKIRVTAPTVKPADLDRYEYEIWKLLSRHQIPSRTQTIIGNELLNLARLYLGLKPESKKPTEYSRPHVLGTAVHYIPKGDDLSRCGRAERSRLRSNRITEDPSKATCGHCKRWAKSDAEHGLIQLDSRGGT